MNNILGFEEYRNRNRASIEENVLMSHYFMGDMILEEDEKSEEKEKEKKDDKEGAKSEIGKRGLLSGLKRWANKRTSVFVKNALADEIEMGKKLDASIQDALGEIAKTIDEVDEELKKSDDKKIKAEDGKNSESLEKIEKIIKDAKKGEYSVESLINEGEIDFVGFLNNMTYANHRCFGIAFLPLMNTCLLRKAYNYFFGIIKQMIRKDLLLISLNFNNFENIILRTALMSDDGRDAMNDMRAAQDILNDLNNALAKGSRLSRKNKDDIAKYSKVALDAFQKKISIERGAADIRNRRYDMVLGDASNVYTRSFETMKQLALEDSQKQLDAIKNSMKNIAQIDQNDHELAVYVEMLISMAEENAYKASSQINNKFIKMCEPFNLKNQKLLVDLVQKADDERVKAAEEKAKKDVEEGEKTAKKETVKKAIEILEKFGCKLEYDESEDKFTKADLSGFDHVKSADEWKRLTDDDKNVIGRFFGAYPEVREEIKDKYARIEYPSQLSSDGYIQYAEFIYDVIKECLDKEKVEKVSESVEYEYLTESILSMRINNFYDCLKNSALGDCLPELKKGKTAYSTPEFYSKENEEDGWVRVVSKDGDKNIKLGTTEKADKIMAKKFGGDNPDASKSEVAHKIEIIVKGAAESAEKKKSDDAEYNYFINLLKYYDSPDDMEDKKDMFCYHKLEKDVDGKDKFVITNKEQEECVEHAFDLIRENIYPKVSKDSWKEFMRHISMVFALDSNKLKLKSEERYNKYNRYCDDLKSYFENEERHSNGSDTESGKKEEGEA